MILKTEGAATIYNISVIIPCYRSADCLADTVREIRKVFSRANAFEEINTHPVLPLKTAAETGSEPVGETDRGTYPKETGSSIRKYRYQIILVNDGSPDGTWDVITALCAADRHIVGINLAANAGQSRAKLAAIPFIRGDYAVFMDDDGQHPAGEITTMIEKLEEGWHMVYAQFPEMKESAWRRFLGRVNNISTSILTRKPFRLRITSFFVLDRVGIRIIRESRPAPFIGATVFRKTRLVTGLAIDHRPRKTGSTNYTLKRLIKLWSDLTFGAILPENTGDLYTIAEVLNPPPGA